MRKGWTFQVTVLSDRDINRFHGTERFSISGFKPERIQPASYDLSLGDKFRVFTPYRLMNNRISTNPRVIDPSDLPDGLTELQVIPPSRVMLLKPQDFILGMTEEVISLGDSVVARIEGKSSLGRLGLVIHSTAGWIDPGFSGNVTLEMTNLSPNTLILTPGMLIAQIAFMPLSITCERPYGSPGLNSKYQGDTEPAESAYASA